MEQDLSSPVRVLITDDSETVRRTAQLYLSEAERGRCHSDFLFSPALGLQPCDRFEREPDAVHPAWSAGRYRDAEGQRWILLDLEGLLSHPDFLDSEAAE